MSNVISKSKQRVEMLLDKKLVAQIDAEATRMEISRTDVVVRACREHLRLDPIPASAAQIDELKTGLVQLNQSIAEVGGDAKSREQKILDAINVQQVAQLPDGKKPSWFKRHFGG